ncbi:hypothetical protein GGR55DRAFT_337463 [Xylaria sp. FL0064]|nr:hypothetical protein GGR55DRAFT_337463 [Xylaria sp. FL0064]
MIEDNRTLSAVSSATSCDGYIPNISLLALLSWPQFSSAIYVGSLAMSFYRWPGNVLYLMFYTIRLYFAMLVRRFCLRSCDILLYAFPSLQRPIYVLAYPSVYSTFRSLFFLFPLSSHHESKSIVNGLAWWLGLGAYAPECRTDLDFRLPAQILRVGKKKIDRKIDRKKINKTRFRS